MILWPSLATLNVTVLPLWERTVLVRLSYVCSLGSGLVSHALLTILLWSQEHRDQAALIITHRYIMLVVKNHPLDG